MALGGPETPGQTRSVPSTGSDKVLVPVGKVPVEKPTAGDSSVPSFTSPAPDLCQLRLPGHLSQPHWLSRSRRTNQRRRVSKVPAGSLDAQT